LVWVVIALADLIVISLSLVNNQLSILGKENNKMIGLEV
jgi:hypothetical protein